MHVVSTVEGWRTRNGCGADVIPVLQDGKTTCTGSGPCANSSEVILCTVQDGVHDWPGGGGMWKGATPPAGFVASLTMLDFFDRHPM